MFYRTNQSDEHISHVVHDLSNMSLKIGDIFGSNCILSLKKKYPDLQCAEQSGICLVSDGSAVNHQSCHKDLESPFFTGSLPAYTVPWECSPPLHGNLKDD